MLVLLNPNAAHGTAAQKWARIEPRLRASLDEDLHVESKSTDLPDTLAQHAQAGERTIIAAGGDGTVHSVINALMTLPAATRHHLRFGAIGLGSSNDFHKPIGFDTLIDRIPLRTRTDDVVDYNLLHCSLVGQDGLKSEHYCAINASLGVIAEGNRFFNGGDWLLRQLKGRWVAAAIQYAALRTLFTYRNFEATIDVDGRPRQIEVSNLSLLLNPHFTGKMAYDTEVTPQSGFFQANLCFGMSKLRQAITFHHLGRGKFFGLPQTSSWKLEAFRLRTVHPVAFEMDGEVHSVTEIEARLVPKALRVLQ